MGRKNTGLTLVELMIVVGIIAILVLIAVAYFRGQIFKGNDAKRKGDIRRIQTAVEEYEKDHDCYPLPQTVVCKPGTGLNPYLSRIPCDPITGASYFYEHEDSSCPTWYRVYTKLDSSSDPDATPGIGPNYAFDYAASSPNAPASASGAPATSPPPGGGGGEEGGGQSQSGFYGCIGAVCTAITWDSGRPGPECDPNYQSSTCYGQCGAPATECVPWN